MQYIDYYKILGLSKNATEKDIKKAYRKMARKYHPDVNCNNKEAEKKFKEINEANEVLGNSENRKKYDEYGENWKHAEQFEKARTNQRRSRYAHSSNYRSQKHSNNDGFSDFFSSMFRGGFENEEFNRTQFRGRDFNAELKLNLTDTLKSDKHTLTVDGKTIRLTIPAGIQHGQTIKIKGKGENIDNHGENGDLYITFNIINNTGFKRHGNDLQLSVDLDLYKAILGGEQVITAIDGKKLKLKVKPNTQNNTQVKLTGKGLPIYRRNDQFGNLYVSYSIKLPENLSVKEIELFEQLAKYKDSRK